MTDLQAAFHVSHTDVVANRAGHATEQQLSRLGAGQGCGWAIVAAVASGLLLFACSIGMVGTASTLLNPDQSIVDWSTTLAWVATRMGPPLLIGGALLAFVSLQRLRIAEDRRVRQVVHCTGAFRLESRFLTTDSLAKTLHIAGRRFKLDPIQARALHPYQDRSIRVYYFPRSRHLAAIEIVSERHM